MAGVMHSAIVNPVVQILLPAALTIAEWMASALYSFHANSIQPVFNVDQEEGGKDYLTRQ